MKKKLLYFLTVGISLISATTVSAQTDVFAVWGLGGTNAAGTVNPTTFVSPDVAAEMVLAGGLRIFSNSTQNAGGAVTPSGDNSNWQRIAMPNPANTANPTLYWEDTAPDNNGKHSAASYMEYNMQATAAGKWLQISGISIPVIGFGTGDVRMIAKYSVDGITFRDFYKSGTYWVKTGETTGEAQAVSLTEASPSPAKRNNTTDGGSTTLAAVTITFTNLQINVEPGKKFYVRLYPYMRGTEPSSSGSRGIQIRGDITLSGKTSDAALPTDVPLPLDFLSFTAKADALGKSVNLNWRTTNEVNTQEFIIEKRTDLTAFTAIGKTPSNNTTGIHNYNFTDNNATKGNAYYRLKQVDNDGEFDYSDIVTVNIKTGISLSVFPNPTDGVLNIAHALATKGSVKVLSLEGKNLVTQAVTEGSTSTSLDISNLSTGTYLVVYDSAGQQSTLKFIKK
ncbi:T9SS type A sorting domain-containing protein [Pedobacter alpinus]|uniref:T9SS type A sorting domain-containing protein n=1 Tax=Pedobacter alpinus TaxID=1590643 RepID=A0ABW5TX59_9SPHI